MGPACWSEEGLEKLLDAGCNVLRFNFSHGDHEGHYKVLERFRQVRHTARANSKVPAGRRGHAGFLAWLQHWEW